MFRHNFVAKYKLVLDNLKNLKQTRINLNDGAIISNAKNKSTNGYRFISFIQEEINNLNIRKTTKFLSCVTCKVNELSSNKNQNEKIQKKNFYNRLCKLNQNGLALSAAGLSIVPNKEPLNIEKEAVTQLSDTTTKTATAVADNLPEPPPVPDAAADIINNLNALGEPTFASLGLGGWSPVGIAQNCFEYLHVTLGVEWWAAIVIGTIVIRLAMFPLVVIAQRNAARMNNYLPQMQIIQLKMTEARQMGNQLEVARYSHELMKFMKEKGLNPFKNMIVPLAQMPIFISFFMALREMANVPIESLRSGGLFWFTDLTVPDQYYLMPVITSLTLLATIELGTDSAKLSAQNMQTMKYVLRALPFIIFPFTINFPGVILCYWVSSNFISLIQVGFLRIPSVRDYFQIEPLIKHSPNSLPVKPKGFTEGIKESWTNIKITQELEERSRLDEFQFQKAGKGPIVKTYKFDPTKVKAADRKSVV